MNRIKSGLEVVWDLRLAEVAESLRENNFRAMTRTEANKRLMSSYGNKKQVHHSF